MYGTAVSHLFTPDSGQAHACLPRHDVALKKGRSDRILASLTLRPAEMKHRTCILHVQSELSILQMPLEIDDALSNSYVFDKQRLP